MNKSQLRAIKNNLPTLHENAMVHELVGYFHDNDLISDYQFHVLDENNFKTPYDRRVKFFQMIRHISETFEVQIEKYSAHLTIFC